MLRALIMTLVMAVLIVAIVKLWNILMNGGKRNL